MAHSAPAPILPKDKPGIKSDPPLWCMICGKPGGCSTSTSGLYAYCYNIKSDEKSGSGAWVHQLRKLKVRSRRRTNEAAIEWRQDHHAATHCQYWTELKASVIRERGGKCERCAADDGPLDLHHKTYERLGEERPEDVELLCRDCHATGAHKIRLAPPEQAPPLFNYAAEKSLAGPSKIKIRNQRR